MDRLPPELILQILESVSFSQSELASFARTCKRHKDLAYPQLYRYMNWIEPLDQSNSLERTLDWMPMFLQGFTGQFVDKIMDPISAMKKRLGLDPKDRKLQAFRKQGREVRELSILTGYQYSRELNILSKICTVTSDATPMLKVISYFPNLTKLELDERAVLSWGAYLGLLADILTSLPHLSDLTLRHRLLNENDEPEVFDKSHIVRKLERGIVSKLRALTIILGRKWEESKMTSYRFSELVDVIGLATAELTSFRLYASYTKLSAETIMERCSEDNSCSKLSLPKLESADIHVRGFADTGALEYITDDSLKRVKWLRFVGNAWEPDLDTIHQNLSRFENLEELDIWDPHCSCQLHSKPSMEDVEEVQTRFSHLFNGFEKLRRIRWTLKCAAKITLFDIRAGSGLNKASVAIKSPSHVPTEEIDERLPACIQPLKREYLQMTGMH